MKISYNWLRTLINIDLTPQNIGEKLTSSGLEVEGIENFESIKGGLQGIVVGEVKSCVKHPNADRLHITQVDIGSDKLLQIVCGAPNVAVGQKVLVAPVGATVHPTEGEPFEIKLSKIRGEQSEGMICAEDELSLGKSHEGILVLPETHEIGQLATTYFQVYNDSVFEIGLTANRGDAASHLGVARDLRALTDCEIVRHEAIYKLPTPSNHKMIIDVEVEDTESCIRYSGISISGIVVKPSPEWMQMRLKAIGLNPINNIVDITNYIMHELGQPLHAFDADKILGKKIIVQKAKAGSIFTTLDGVERKLNGTECMICDTERPLAIAGVYGGLQSGITNDTNNIFIESAYFNPVSIRKTAKLHGLSTDSSFRYERGTDPQITDDAIKRAVQLIMECAGGEVSSNMSDYYPIPVKPAEVAFRIHKFYELIGQSIPVEKIVSILNGLGISVHQNQEGILNLIVPPYKGDVTREADVAEEILRIYGLDNIEIPSQLKSSLARSADEDAWLLKGKVAQFLTANGFVEMLSNSLTKSEYYEEDERKHAVKLLNPLSNDLNILRMSLLFNGLEMIQYNKNRKINDIRAFEFGFVYRQAGEKFIETSMLSMILSGNKVPENWQHSDSETTLFQLKSYAAQLFNVLGIKEYKWKYDSNHPEFSTTIELVHDKITLGYLGFVKHNLSRKFDIETPVLSAMFDWKKLLEAKKKSIFNLKEVSPFPAVRRDLALLIDKSVQYASLEQTVRKCNVQLIKEVSIFDIYEGDKLPQGKKSYAISIMLQNEEKTMTDEETDTVMKQVISQLQKETGAELRA
jgi:phenylalanyl-tRNA synthetase beta chain